MNTSPSPAPARSRRALLALAFATTALVACGGAGGDAAPTPTPAPPPPSPATARLERLAGVPNGAGNLDGQARAARFFNPSDTASDDAGNVYVVESANNAVRKVAPDGTVSTLAGLADPQTKGAFADGPGASARFSVPLDIVRTAGGTLVVSDSGNHALRSITREGVVTTLAGRGGAEGSDDGPAATARLASPTRMALGAGGDLYFIDQGAHAVRRLSPGGQVATLAGRYDDTPVLRDGPGAIAALNSVTAIAVDAQETRLIVADTDPASGQRVLRSVELDFTNYTVNTLLVLDRNGDPYPFGAIRDMVFDANGTLLVLADAGQRIVRVDFGTNQAEPWAGTLRSTRHGAVVDGPPDTAFFTGNGFSRDALGNLWLADEHQLLRRVSSEGQVTTLAGQGSPDAAPADGPVPAFFHPDGLAADASGTLWVADGNTLRKISRNGVVSTLAGRVDDERRGLVNGEGSSARFSLVADVALDGAGNAYVVDTYNNAVRKVYPDGTVTTLAGGGSSGSADGTGSEARFFAPFGVAADRQGTVYVADTFNNRVRRISPAGRVLTVDATFHYPRGVALDADGNVYVADTADCTVRKITPDGEVSTLAGAPGERGTADGQGGAARFDYPVKLAWDPRGFLLVAEGGGNVVRKVTPSGVVTTVLGVPGRQGTRPGPLPTSLGSLRGLAVMPDGQLAISADDAVFVTRDASF